MLILLAFLLAQSALGPLITGSEVEDRSIIEAALRDPALIERTDFGRYDLASKTFLGWAPWTVTEPPLDANLSLDGTQITFPMPLELVESIRVRNSRPISLKGFTRPGRTKRTSERRLNPWRRVAVSRPGISRDGSKAIIVVFGTEGDCKPSGCAHGGYTAYLERRGGVWRVIGHGGSWIE